MKWGKSAISSKPFHILNNMKFPTRIFIRYPLVFVKIESIPGIVAKKHFDYIFRFSISFSKFPNNGG